MKNFKTVLIVAGLLMAWAFVPGSQAHATVANCTTRLDGSKYCTCGNVLGCYTSSTCTAAGCSKMCFSLTPLKINGYDPNALRDISLDEGFLGQTISDFNLYNAGTTLISAKIFVDQDQDWTLGATAAVNVAGTGSPSVDVIGSMTFTPGSTMNLGTAILRNTGIVQGAGEVTANVLNGGTLASMGSPAGFKITGGLQNYRHLHGVLPNGTTIDLDIPGVLAFQLGGTTPCGDGLDCGSGAYYSTLHITGGAALAGNLPGILNVPLSTGYLPSPTNTFDIIRADQGIPVYLDETTGSIYPVTTVRNSQCFWDQEYYPYTATGPPVGSYEPGAVLNVRLTNARCADAGIDLPPVTSESAHSTTIPGNITGITSDGSANDYAHYTYSWKEGDTVLAGPTPVTETGGCPLNLSTVPLSTGQHTLVLEVTRDNKPGIFDDFYATDDMILTIDNSAPHAAPTGAGTYQVNTSVALGGSVSDFDGDTLTYRWLDGSSELTSGSIGTSAGGTPAILPEFFTSELKIGNHTITLEVTDGTNGPVSASVDVEIIDTGAPTLNPIPTKTILWPPNHQMVNVSIQANATDNSGLPPMLTAKVSSSEPQDGLGDGDTPIDWTDPVIDPATGTISLQLRAERSGKGGGRTYTVAITATDLSGNASTANVNIIVPHDKSKK
jgi:hypothetical protein